MADPVDLDELDDIPGGVSGKHPPLELIPILAAPATGKEKNTLRQELVPIACWGLHDVRFEFGSSFVKPQTKKEFAVLIQLRKDNPGSPMSVFGHADPVGDDPLNKRLSGNRAESIYAIIVHEPARWEELYNSAGPTEGWGIGSIQQMLTALGHNPGPVTRSMNPDTKNAIIAFQNANGVSPANGTADAKTRAKIFGAYMTFLCPEPATPADFLAGGSDPGRKGDMQGCGEFNPQMMFSQEEAKRFSKPENKAERDQDNSQNRRVIVFLFRPGTTVPAAKWPCPRVNEGIDACKKRFWSDAATRRSNHPERREFKDKKDTFACRFYHRLAIFSPCEGVPAPIPTIYLRLSFIDPEGVVRRFPAGVPVTVLYGPELSPPGAGEAVYQTLSEGRLTFPAWLATVCRTVTLRFRWTNQIPYLFYEDAGAPSPPEANRYAAVATGAADPPYLSVPAAAGAPSPPRAERAFSLPPSWDMIEADWYVPGTGARPFAPRNGAFGNVSGGSYDPATGRISQTTTPGSDIGSEGAPIEFVLDPHWRMFRLEFFDRYYGNAALNSPPTAGHGRRISTPPVWLEGFRNDVNAAGAEADTVSNWTIGADPKDRLQCLPFVLARTNAGAALPAPTGTTLGLRFRTHQTLRTYIFSQSDTVRELRDVENSPPGTPTPGPDRLRFYDMPRIWRSKRYYTRNVTGSPPPGDGKHFQALTAAEIQAADFNVQNTAAPGSLNFCLDDIVLTNTNFVQLPLGALPAAPAIGDRITLFHHKFGNRPYDSVGTGAGTIPNVSNEGVYKPGAVVDVASYPYSDIAMPVRYYVEDYPDWTRLVMAQGNVYDVFEDRTADAGGNEVVGARAAVRWVDATTAPNGTAALNAAAGTTGAIAPRPGLVQQNYFSMQPFIEQDFIVSYGGVSPQAAPIYHNEWTAAYGATADQTGRYDILHLRCCDYDGTDEVSVLLRYLRTDFDFTTASQPPGNVGPNPMAGSTAAQRMAWAQFVINNTMGRWNGHDAVNNARVWATPRQFSPPVANPQLKTQCVSIFQYLSTARSHFCIRCAVPNGTSWMAGTTGEGQIRINAATHDDGSAPTDIWGQPMTGRGLASAHEIGHGISLPDEYDNNGNDSLDYTALNLVGSPYNLEARGMMFFNWHIRARYLWASVEWLRTLNNLGAVSFRLIHNDTNAPGAPLESNYFQLPYPHLAANPKRNFVCWPVSFNIRQRTAPNTSNFDSYLYMLGDDKYASVVLPAAGPAGAPFDGMLIVLLRIRVDFSAIGGNNANRVRARNRFFNAVKAAVEPRLNNLRTAQMSLLAGSPANTPQFQRCLLRFTCCFTTVGVPTSNSAAGLNAAAPAHLSIVMASAGVAAPAVASFANNAPPAAKVLTINLPNNFLTLPQATRDAQMATAGGFVFQHACTTLGLSNLAAPAAGSFQTPASYVPIVRTVIDATAPNPVIS